MHSAARNMFANRYRLDQAVGGGPSTTVWRAFDTRTDHPVALKFLGADLLRNAEDLAVLEDIVARVRELEHPAIVRPHELVFSGDQVAVLSDWVEGTNLGELRAAQPARCFEVDYIKPLVSGWAETMEAAHARRVVHGALKPSDVFVDGSGAVFVTDFGVGAWVEGVLVRRNRTSVLSACAPYRSPGQLRGEGPFVTDDIYAFGAIVYELVTGSQPFARGKLKRKKDRMGTPVSMADRRRQSDISGAPIPVVWEQTILACLDRDGFARPLGFRKVLERIDPQRVRRDATPTRPEVEKVAEPEPVAETPAEVITAPSEEGIDESVELPVAAETRASMKEASVNVGGATPASSSAATPSTPPRAPSHHRRWPEPLADEPRAPVGAGGGGAGSRVPKSPRAQPLLTPGLAIPEPRERFPWDVYLLRTLAVLVLFAILAVGGRYGWHAFQGGREYARLGAELAQFSVDAAPEHRASLEQEIDAAQSRLTTQQWRALRSEFTRRDAQWKEHQAVLRLGGVAIRVSPPEASIQFAEQTGELGRLEANGLEPGRYPLHVRLEGYAPHESTVEIEPGQTAELQVQLERLTGGLRLEAEPGGTEFELRGFAEDSPVQQGKTPADLNVPVGQYRITFRRPGHAPQTEIVRVEADQTARARAEFPEGTVAVSTGDVAGARVAIDGAPIGETPLQLTLPAGEHVLDVTFADGRTERRYFGLQARTVQEFAIEPPRPPAPAPEPVADALVAPLLNEPAPPSSAASEQTGSLDESPVENVNTTESAASPEPAEADEAVDLPIAAESQVSDESAAGAPAPSTSHASTQESTGELALAPEAAVIAVDSPSTPPATPEVSPAPAAENPTVSPPAPAVPPDGAANVPARGVVVPSPPPPAPPAQTQTPEVEPVQAPSVGVASDEATLRRVGVDYTQIFNLGEVDIAPQLLERVNPELPRRYRSGRVELLVVIDRSGYVSSAAVRSSTNTALVEASLRAVRLWRFSPARKDGQRVAVRAVIPLVFKGN